MESRVLSRAATSLSHLRRLPRHESTANVSFVPAVRRSAPCVADRGNLIWGDSCARSCCH
ncbi:hypothetical protein HN51_007638 [Arachis hypogaea]